MLADLLAIAVVSTSLKQRGLSPYLLRLGLPNVDWVFLIFVKPLVGWLGLLRFSVYYHTLNACWQVNWLM